MTLRRWFVLTGLTLAFGLAVSTVSAQAEITYVADLNYVQSAAGDACQVYPDPLCRARGRVDAALQGDFLVLEGVYSALSGPVTRDLATGVHLHHDLALYHLDTLMSGLQSWGDTEGRILDAVHLTPDEQLMLAQGRLYIDIHTVYVPDGEIRGLLRPIMPLEMEVSAR